jgi:hypothetical protein
MKKKKSKIHQDNVGIYTISRRQGRGDCPERPGYFQHALLIPQMGSGFPRKVCLTKMDPVLSELRERLVLEIVCEV